GFIPPDLMIDGVEVSRRVALSKARQVLPEIGKLPCISSSDAHFLKDIGTAHTVFSMAAATIAEIRLALRGEQGRRIQA
ncbi:MAG: PHP-associated domain-containing protein, partial [Hyphomicrobiales bacterium]